MHARIVGIVDPPCLCRKRGTAGWQLVATKPRAIVLVEKVEKAHDEEVVVVALQLGCIDAAANDQLPDHLVQKLVGNEDGVSEYSRDA